MPRGAKPGERRGGGRKKGSVNKTTLEIRELALKYAPAALLRIVDLATSAKHEQVRFLANNTILDRAYGKPSQSIAHSGAVGTFDADRFAKLSDEELNAFVAFLARLNGDDPAGHRPSLALGQIGTATPPSDP